MNLRSWCRREVTVSYWGLHQWGLFFSETTSRFRKQIVKFHYLVNTRMKVIGSREVIIIPSVASSIHFWGMKTHFST